MSAEGRPLVEPLREALSGHCWDGLKWTAHRAHNFDGACAICRGDVTAIADVTAAVVREWLADEAGRVTPPVECQEETA